MQDETSLEVADFIEFFPEANIAFSRCGYQSFQKNIDSLLIRNSSI